MFSSCYHRPRKVFKGGGDTPWLGCESGAEPLLEGLRDETL